VYTLRVSNKILLIPILLIVTLFLFRPSALATTIILIRTQNEIVVGADSKGTNEYDKQKNKLFCKINQVGDLMFAASGFVEDKDTGFSVNKIVAEAANKGGTINEIATRIDTALVQPLNDAILHFKKISPDVYKKQIKNHNGVTFQLILFRFEKEIPVVYKKNFGEPNLVSNTIPAIGEVIRCPGKDCQGNRTLMALGSNAVIKDYLKQTPLSSTIEIGSLIQNLIMLQIKKTPHEVGLPIDIVRYDKTGIHWIQRKVECQE
jgi:hypothetical protein